MAQHFAYLERKGEGNLSLEFVPNVLRMAYERTLRRGKHRLFLWKDVEADGSVNTKTPSKTEIKDEMGRLEKVCLLFAKVDSAVAYKREFSL